MTRRDNHSEAAAHPEDALGVGERYDEIARCMAAGHRHRAAAIADAFGWLAGRVARRAAPVPRTLRAGRAA